MMDEWEARKAKLVEKIAATTEELGRRRGERDSRARALAEERSALEAKRTALLAERSQKQQQLQEQLEQVSVALAELDREKARLQGGGSPAPLKPSSPRGEERDRVRMQGGSPAQLKLASPRSNAAPTALDPAFADQEVF